jgi:metallo-beta-lactamase family protein
MVTLSAHADMNELVSWASASSHAPMRTYLNHGEMDATIALRETMRQRLGWQVEIPHHGDAVNTAAFIRERKRVPAHA